MLDYNMGNDPLSDPNESSKTTIKIASYKKAVFDNSNPTTISSDKPISNSSSYENMSLNRAIKNATSFAQFAPIVKNAKENISFFGRRYIYAKGFKGRVDLYALATKAGKLLKKNYGFTEQDRTLGKEIFPLIDKLFDDNFARKKNLITRVFTAVRHALICVGIAFIMFFGNYHDPLISWKSNYSNYEIAFDKPSKNPLCSSN